MKRANLYVVGGSMIGPSFGRKRRNRVDANLVSLQEFLEFVLGEGDKSLEFVQQLGGGYFYITTFCNGLCPSPKPSSNSNFVAQEQQACRGLISILQELLVRDMRSKKYCSDQISNDERKRFACAGKYSLRATKKRNFLHDTVWRWILCGPKVTVEHVIQ